MSASIQSMFNRIQCAAHGKAIRNYAWILAAGWTVVIVCSFWWAYYQHNYEIAEFGRTEAKAAAERDLLYRRWTSVQGGLYVTPSDKYPPNNPYMSHVPDRDVITTSGRKLTLINPACMTRQVYELALENKFAGRGHLTSLKPIRPENGPDPWERKSLLAFEAGAKEVSEIQELDGQRFMRLMLPFVAEQSCLKCHALQGNKVGEIRGGLSVSIPLAGIEAAAHRELQGNAFAHGMMFLLGLGVIGLGANQLSRSARAQKEAENELYQLNLQLGEEVAEREASQDELERLNRFLEERVDKAVSDLRRKDQMLIQQSRLAAMGEMINNIAHQWRQPLNNIGLIIQNLQISFDSGTISREEMESEIGKAMSVIMHMSRTIDDFRNFFREDKEKQSFYVNRAVNRALEFVSAALWNRGIQVEIEAEQEIAVTGYPSEYAQVLLNIINNASEVCAERCIVNPRIVIRITRENERSLVCIRDNCGGIPDDIMPKIFDPYFTTRDPDKGSGIGLYMSKVIVEQNMGGRLTARNVDGGAEFSIEV